MRILDKGASGSESGVKIHKDIELNKIHQIMTPSNICEISLCLLVPKIIPLLNSISEYFTDFKILLIPYSSGLLIALSFTTIKSGDVVIANRNCRILKSLWRINKELCDI